MTQPTWKCQSNKSVMSAIRLCPANQLVYNAQDHPDHKRGRNDYGPKSGPVALLWSVWKIENGMAHCRASNAGTRVICDCYDKIVPVETLIPYERS